MRRPRLPAWTATITWKAAVFITVMCCALAALLGALDGTSVGRVAAREPTLEDAYVALVGGDEGAR